MTPERKQELLDTFARKGDAEPVEDGCCQLSDLTVGELRELLTEIERLQSQRCETCRFVGRNDFGEPHVYFGTKGERSHGCEYGGHHFVPTSHGCTAHEAKEDTR